MSARITPRQLALLVALTLMWGCNWPMMKIALRETGPLWFRALTMSGGMLVLAAWVALRGMPRERLVPTRAQWRALALLTLPNVVGWHLASIIGLTQLPAGRASILAFTMPVWTVVLGTWWFGQPLTRRAWVASVCAVMAVVLLTAHEFATLAGRPAGVLWLQGAAVSWALGTLLLRRWPIVLAPEAIAVITMALGSMVFLALAIAFEAPPSPARWSGTMWAAMAWSVIVNFGISQAIWFALAQALPAQASTFSLMAVPLVGLLSSALVMGESPRANDWLAMLFIAAAIAAATLRHSPDNAQR